MKPETLEIVLNELLEEQKKETITNAEMIMIVKIILQKLEAIEESVNAFQQPEQPDRLRAIQISNKAILEGQQTLDAKLSDLKSMTTAQPVPAPQPVTVIKYRNNYKIIGCIIAASALFISVLCMLYNFKKNEASFYQSSDIKYRYIKLLAGNYLRRSLAATDSLYLSDPGGMKNTVDSMEAAAHNMTFPTVPGPAKDSAHKRRLK